MIKITQQHFQYTLHKYSCYKTKATSYKTSPPFKAFVMAQFRSNTMSKVEVIFNDIELVKQFVNEMGHLECIQFVDLQKNTSNLNKPYSKDLLDVKQLINQINVVQQIMDQYQSLIPINPHTENKQNDSTLQQDDISNMYQLFQSSQNDEQNIKNALLKQNHITKSLSTQINLFIDKQQQKHASKYNEHFVGFVTNTQRPSFQRQIYLTAKQNAVIEFYEDGNENVFVVFYNGDSMQRTLHRICNVMSIEICYDSSAFKDDEKSNKDAMLWDSIQKSEALTAQHNAIIETLQENIEHNAWKVKRWKQLLLKQKAIKSVLNMCDISYGNNVIQAIKMHGWCSGRKQGIIKQTFEEITMNQSGCSLVFQEVSNYNAQDVAPTSFENSCVFL
eukprot:597639_1